MAWHGNVKPVFACITFEGFYVQAGKPAGEKTIHRMQHYDVCINDEDAWSVLVRKYDKVSNDKRRRRVFLNWIKVHTTYSKIDYDPELFKTVYATCFNNKGWKTLEELIETVRKNFIPQKVIKRGRKADFPKSDSSDSDLTDSDTSDSDLSDSEWGNGGAGSGAGSGVPASAPSPSPSASTSKEVGGSGTSDKIKKATEALTDLGRLTDSTSEKTLEDISFDVYQLYGFAPSEDKTKLIHELHELKKKEAKLHREASEKFGIRKGDKGKRRRIGD